MSEKLIQERPLLVLPSLVTAVGGSLAHAMILQQIHFLCSIPDAGEVVDGKKYVYNTYDEWVASYFPFWTAKNLQKHMLKLEEKGFIETVQPHLNRGNATKYYRVNTDSLLMGTMGSPKVDHGVPKSRRSIYKEQRLLTEIEEKRGAVAPMSSSDELNGDAAAKSEVAVVFDYWKTVLQHPKAKLDSSRRQKIQRRLKEFTVADLKKAIDGVARSPFYLGDNDRKRKYDGIETIFRNAAKVEQFIEVAETASPLDVPGGLMDNEKALEERRRRLQ